MRGRFALLTALTLGTLLASGCQKYVELTSVSDRIWMISKDQTEVFRCWDMKNQTGKLIAVCRHAQMLGTNENSRLVDIAESTAPASHGDSTEIGPISSSLAMPGGPQTASRPVNSPR